jgi:predicted branched-subunit amino acid permease
LTNVRPSFIILIMRSPHPSAEPAPDEAAVRRAWRDGVGVAVATSAYGVSFGALSVAAGLDLWQTCILSLVMFTGGSQFAFVGVIAAGGVAAAPAAIASAGLLGARNVAYGLRMSPVIGAAPAARAAAAHFTIDESTAVSLAQTGLRARRVGFWVTGIGIWLGWNISTLAGGLLGDVLGDPRAYGLDAAAAAAFLALLWPRLKRRQAVAVGVAAAVVATVLTPAIMPGIPVLVAALVAVLVGWANWWGSDEATRRDPAPSTGGGVAR